MSIQKNVPNLLKHSGFSFTTILNKTIEVIEDPAALGIYVYLASKPMDWKISETNLRNRFNKGGDFIRSRLAYLKKLGLLKSIAIRDEKQRILRWETVLYSEIQKGENPTTGEVTHVENTPPFTNKRIKKIKDLYKEKVISPQTPEKKDSLFLSKEQMLTNNPHNLSEELIEDWIKVRKSKRAPITNTAWIKINLELSKINTLGINPTEAFETMVASGWQSLKASYWDNGGSQSNISIRNTNNKPKKLSLEDIIGA